MKRAVMTGLLAVLFAALGYCGWRYYSEVYLPNKHIIDADKSQRELFKSLRPELAGIPAADESGSEDASSPGKETKDWLADLRAENPDVVGWLTIDGTAIDYPIVQTKDNSYYLQNGFDKKYNYGLGCPFLDYRCDSGFGGFDSIVYAHHIRGNQAMFADIARYKDAGFMKKYPTGQLLTADGVHEVRFFAYMTIPSTAFAYKTGLSTRKEKDEYIDGIFDNASYTIEYTPQGLKADKELHLLLLSTCTYEYWEARGVLAGVIE